MLRKLSFILSVLFILFFQTQSFALKRVIPCKAEQCSDANLLRKVAIKNTDDLGNGQAKVYFYNLDTETAQYFNVFRERDLEFGGLNIVRARGPFNGSVDENAIIKRVYDIEKDVFVAIGNPNPPPRRDLIGSNGDVLGSGYAAVAFNMFGLSFTNLGSNVTVFGTSRWLGMYNNLVMNALVNLTGASSTVAVAELLNNAVSQQQVAASQLGTTQLTAGANGLIFHADGTFTNSRGETVTITNSNLPPELNIKMTDGLVHLKWKPGSDKFIVDEIMDSEGNVIKVNEDGTIGVNDFPTEIYISDANIVLWQIIATRWALFSLKAQLDALDGVDCASAGCRIIIHESPKQG